MDWLKLVKLTELQARRARRMQIYTFPAAGLQCIWFV